MIHRTKHISHFTTLPNWVYDEEDVSFEASALHAWLLSRPANWHILPVQLRKRTGWGRNKIYALLNELVASGRILRRRVKGGKGRFVRWEYEVFDQPSRPLPGFQHVENRHALTSTEVYQKEEAQRGRTESKRDSSESEREKKDRARPLLRVVQ